MHVLSARRLCAVLVGSVSAWMPSAERRGRGRGRHTAPVVILQSSRGQPGHGSYVEGDVFEDPLQEIEALGGDPFFLDNGDKGGIDNDKNSDGEGNFLWDGEIDENAHMDLDLD